MFIVLYFFFIYLFVLCVKLHCFDLQYTLGTKQYIYKKIHDALVDSLFRLVSLAFFGLSKQEFSVFKIKIQ